MQRLLSRTHMFPALLGLILVSASSSAVAQYKVRYLDANVKGRVGHTDPLLQNAWGLAYGPGGPFWISDEASGYSTLYDGRGNPQSLQVVIPSASGSGLGSPTGIVFNGSQEFAIDSWVSIFMFATLDGTISGWSPFSPNLALIGVSSPGSVYTGLAITNKASGNFLYAADAANNKVDIYDGSFNLVGSFTDTTLPAGFAPFGINDINGQLYVTFASAYGSSGGFVDVFNEDGTFVKQLAHGSPLDQPWGTAIAPGDFGKFSNAVLVSNNTAGGTINGYNPNNGKLIGTLKDSSGKAIIINGLWGIEFGGGTAADGAKNQLFFTAGPNDTNGFFGVIGND
jgi:uncharacterized protein (TIGR03118 family)